MTTNWQPYREPLRVTVMRTGLIAVVIAAGLSARRGGAARWPMTLIMALWISFGGHWVEIFFLNWLRPRIADARALQIAARVAVWFVGGAVLMQGVRLSVMALRVGAIRSPTWWIGGLAFIGIEMVVHLILQLRGQPSFYNGHG